MNAVMEMNVETEDDEVEDRTAGWRVDDAVDRVEWRFRDTDGRGTPNSWARENNKREERFTLTANSHRLPYTIDTLYRVRSGVKIRRDRL